MRTAVIVGPIAVTTEYWEESQADGTRETGCRVQLRRVRDRACARAAAAATPRRGLLDDRGAGLAGRPVHGRRAAPRHSMPPTTTRRSPDLVPCERVADPAIEADPFGWIERRLADVPAMLAEAGHPELADGARRGRAPAGDAGGAGHDPGDPRLPTPSERDGMTAGVNRQARRLRVGVVGLDHYHVTGWVETIEGFPDELEIVALYDPDPELARTLAPTHHDPSLRPGLGEAYRGAPGRDDAGRPDRAPRPRRRPRHAPNRRRTGRDRAPGRGRDPHAHRQAGGPDRARGATGVRCRPGRRGPRGGRPHAALLAGGPNGARDWSRPVGSGGSSRPRRSSRRRPSRSATRATRSSTRRGAGGGILSWLGIHDVDTLLWLTRRAGRRGRRDGRPASGTRASRSRMSSRSRCASPAAPSAPSTSPTRCRRAATGAGSRCAAWTPRWSSASTRSWSSLTAGGQDGGVLEERIAFDVPAVAGLRRLAVVPRCGTSSTRSATAARRQAGGEAIVRALEVIDAAYESARTGTRVRLA